MLLKLPSIILLNMLLLSLSFADEGMPNSLSIQSVWTDNIIFLLIAFIILILFVFLMWFYWRNTKRDKTLEENTAHFKTLLESTAAIPWEVDLATWQFTYVGPQIEIVSGYKPEEWYAENFWTDHLHPVDKDKSILFCTEATDRHEDHEFEYRFIKKDGNTIWIRDAVQVIVEDGIPVALRGFMFDITKQKIEQENQKNAERRLAEAQNIAHVGSWDLDLLTNDLQWSEETFRIFEVNPVLVKPSYEGFVSFIHPDDRERVNQAYQDSLQTKLPYNIEHRLLMPDGRVKFVNEQCDTEYNDEGQAIRSYGTVQDITERKRTDEAIKTIASAVSSTAGDDFYQELVTNMAEMFNADYAFIGLLDESDVMQVNTYMLYAHGKIAPNMSYSLIGTPCVNVVGKQTCVYPEYVQQLFPDDKLLVDMGVDSYIGIPLFSGDGKATGIVVVADSKPMKNTAQMEEVLKIFAARTEAELERKKSNETIQKLSLAVEQSPNIIIITDAEGKIEYVNPAFIETTGYSREEVLNKNPSIIKSGEMPRSFYTELWQTITSGKTWSGIFHNRRSNGELYWDEAKISPIKNAQGDITHYLGVQSDITDKKQIEQQLRRSQKMDALGKLTGGIAHDYNNMLNVILGYTEMMEMVLSDTADEKVKEFLKEIQHATARGATLTKKLLAFSRHDSTQPESVDINKLLLDAQNMLEKTLTARINLKYQLADSIWPVYLDKGDLEDAILNMCINAMHAMPDGGDLIITSFNRTLFEDEAVVINLPAGDYVQLSISDSGSGISEDVLNQIFDPFFTTKGELGTGLGLTQVYGFIKRAKGVITIDSSLNQGTYILIYFPRHCSEVEPDEIISDEIIEQKGSENILVVDDEAAICELSKTLLTSKGYNVLVAESGDAALKILESNNDIDLILSDVVMPNMDGYKLAAKVREKYPQIKIQLVSGFDDDRKRTEEDQLLYKYLLHKPYTASNLFDAVRKCLIRKQDV
ncbi:MAG: PAS domain S-box protein [Gammaproteobacteria bacterium]|nr:PAS domain S-box protein [Gammaproteobacteria bacterium]